MAQFDVYRNPSIHQREAIPYMVNVQSDLLDSLPTRLMMPLARPGLVPTSIPRNLCPPADFGGERFHLLAQMVSSFRTRDLGKPVGAVTGRASDIVAALDAVISGV
jgi:toxin CcdB